MATTKITNPELFDLGSLNTALRLPSGSTDQRPTSPSTGEWRYNTTTNLVEFWDGGAWRDLQSEDIPPIPSDNFNTITYTGDGTNPRSITGVGFKPDLLWIKKRNNSDDNVWFDTTRGPQKELISNSNAAEATKSGDAIISFDSDGFTTGNNGAINANGDTYVAWCWKANGGTTSSNSEGSITSTVQTNTKAGFSVVKYTADGTNNTTIGHGLGVAPEFIVIKKLTATGDWITHHQAVGTGNFLYLNRDDAQLTQAGIWSNINSSTFNLISGYNDYNQSGQDYIAYCFAPKAQYSKFGSYTGTGSTTNRPIINTGFEPAFVMIKNFTTADDWMIHDNKRNPSNPRDRYLRANTADQEGQFAEFGLDFLTNGFIVGPTTNNNWNGSGQTYLYIAFASDPSTSPALNDSFANKIYSGNSSSQSITGVGFSPNFLWIKQRNGSEQHYLYDTIRGSSKYLHSNLTSSEGTDATTRLTSFDSDGFSLGSDGAVNGSGSNYISWNWKANPLPTINTDGTIQSVVSANQAAGISIVKWDGTGSASTVGHGLSSAPEIIFTKRLNGSGDWYSFSVFANGGTTPANYFLKLNSTDAETLNTGSPPSIFAGTVPTDTVFSVGTTLSGSSSDSYIAYCFTSISGFSKIGTYTGNGSTTGPVVTTGFQPDFLIYKASSQSGNWGILDSARDTSNPRSEWMAANLSNAESPEPTREADFLSTGFQPKGTNSDINASGQTYIYMAFKENPSPIVPAGQMAFLNIAGGASGGIENSRSGGGGGAGGFRTSFGTTSGGGASAESNITLAAETYTITIGAGGASSSSSPSAGNDGSLSSIAASSITTISSVGGGGGGAPGTGRTGGSGGGGAHGGNAGGAGTANQGFAGGTGTGESPYAGAGGGGAGAVGSGSSAGSAGTGGNGVEVSITGTATFYAGGGGGGGSADAAGGTGGGGHGATGTANAGTTNTGSGGGGAQTASGAGGSGVVILRMRTSDYSGSTTGSPTVTTTGEETVLTYTGSGTYVHS